LENEEEEETDGEDAEKNSSTQVNSNEEKSLLRDENEA